MPDLGCWGGQIVEGHAQSVILKCECGIRGWHTKNIGYIGARNIYNFKGGCNWMQEQMTCFINECDCVLDLLSVDEELMKHVASCKECQEYGL
jgi:hypothetical protein